MARGAALLRLARGKAKNSVKLAAAGGAAFIAGGAIGSLFGNGTGTDPYRTDGVQFPNDLQMNGNWIQFIAKTTTGGAIGGLEGILGQIIGSTGTQVSGGKILLPLPGGLSTDYHPTYSVADLGTAGMAIKPFDRGMYGNTDIPSGAAATGALQGAGVAALKGAADKLVGSGGGAPGAGAAALKVIAGIAENPNKIVLFTGVDFREHSFNWKLSPRNRDESKAIRRIIEMFTYYSHPEFVSGGLFLKYPEYFEISFKRDAYLFKLRPSVCNGIKVDYHGQGYPAYIRDFDGGGEPAPAEVTLSLSFKETEIISKQYLNPSTPEERRVTGPTDMPMVDIEGNVIGNGMNVWGRPMGSGKGPN